MCKIGGENCKKTKLKFKIKKNLIQIGSLSEKEFRIIIVKMIKNLENKMELQINRLETRIAKMQEMFNKDVEEIRESINKE